MSDAPDAYKVLQVDPEAEDEVIQAAYRRLAQKYHPDRSSGQAAIDRMVAINAAWEAIGEPAKRAAYDLARRTSGGAANVRAPTPTDGGGSAAGGAAASGPFARRAAAGPSGAGGPAQPGSGPRSPRPPEAVSRDWTPGRSTIGGGYDAGTMRAPEGLGAAGQPPGNPSGSVLNFGRYAGWSLGEIGRSDLVYIEWLDRMPIGRPYREEIDEILRRAGRRKSATTEASQRRGLFRRR